MSRFIANINSLEKLTFTSKVSNFAGDEQEQKLYFPTTTAHCCRGSTAVRCMILNTLQREVAIDVLPLGEKGIILPKNDGGATDYASDARGLYRDF